MLLARQMGLRQPNNIKTDDTCQHLRNPTMVNYRGSLHALMQYLLSFSRENDKLDCSQAHTESE